MFQMRSIALLKNHKNLFQQRNQSTNVGFIGIGNMGARMATNLIKKGHKLKIYDASKAAAQSINGALVCASPQEAVTDVKCVFTMLPEGATVKSVLTSDNGILKGISKDTLWIDSSTIDPLHAQEFHKISGNAGIKFLDAPVSGGTAGAAAATLTFMVGGNEDIVKEAEPYLMQLGARLIHCGGPGAGQVAKLCNNLIVGISITGVAEAMNLGAKMGLDLKTLMDVINTSTGRCWSSENYNPVPGLIPNIPANNDYEGGFQTKLLAKDLALAQSMAANCGVPIPLGSAAHQLYRTMIATGLGNKDFAVVYKFLQGDNTN